MAINKTESEVQYIYIYMLKMKYLRKQFKKKENKLVKKLIIYTLSMLNDEVVGSM